MARESVEPTAGLEPAPCCLRKPCMPPPPPPGRCHPLPGAAVLPARAPKSAGLTSRLLPSDAGACRRGGGSDGGSDRGMGPASRWSSRGRAARVAWQARRRPRELRRALAAGAARRRRRRGPAPDAPPPPWRVPVRRVAQGRAASYAAAPHPRPIARGSLRRARGGPPRRDAPVRPGRPGSAVRAGRRLLPCTFPGAGWAWGTRAGLPRAFPRPSLALTPGSVTRAAAGVAAPQRAPAAAPCAARVGARRRIGRNVNEGALRAYSHADGLDGQHSWLVVPSGSKAWRSGPMDAWISARMGG